MQKQRWKGVIIRMWFFKWQGYPEQNYQGKCPYCNYEMFEFLKQDYRKERTEKDFKNVIGYSLDSNKNTRGKEIIILLECPKCFEKSYFHVDKSWIEDYGKWLKNIDE